MSGIARLSHGAAWSWPATDFASSLALCQDDVLPAITLFQRASKASTSDDERVGSAFGLVACNLLLSLQHADARDAASAAADSLRHLCLALAGSAPYPGGTQPHFRAHPGADPRDPTCQGALLSCLTHALACWYRSCSSSNSSSVLVAVACCNEAHAILGQVLDMLRRALGPTTAATPGCVAAAGAGLEHAAAAGGCTPRAAADPVSLGAEQLLIVMEQAASTLQRGLSCARGTRNNAGDANSWEVLACGVDGDPDSTTAPVPKHQHRHGHHRSSSCQSDGSTSGATGGGGTGGGGGGGSSVLYLRSALESCYQLLAAELTARGIEPPPLVPQGGAEQGQQHRGGQHPHHHHQHNKPGVVSITAVLQHRRRSSVGGLIMGNGTPPSGQDQGHGNAGAEPQPLRGLGPSGSEPTHGEERVCSRQSSVTSRAEAAPSLHPPPLTLPADGAVDPASAPHGRSSMRNSSSGGSLAAAIDSLLLSRRSITAGPTSATSSGPASPTTGPTAPAPWLHGAARFGPAGTGSASPGGTILSRDIDRESSSPAAWRPPLPLPRSSSLTSATSTTASGPAPAAPDARGSPLARLAPPGTINGAIYGNCTAPPVSRSSSMTSSSAPCTAASSAKLLSVLSRNAQEQQEYGGGGGDGGGDGGGGGGGGLGGGSAASPCSSGSGSSRCSSPCVSPEDSFRQVTASPFHASSYKEKCGKQGHPPSAHRNIVGAGYVTDGGSRTATSARSVHTAASSPRQSTGGSVASVGEDAVGGAAALVAASPSAPFRVQLASPLPSNTAAPQQPQPTSQQPEPHDEPQRPLRHSGHSMGNLGMIATGTTASGGHRLALRTNSYTATDRPPAMYGSLAPPAGSPAAADGFGALALQLDAGGAVDGGCSRSSSPGHSMKACSSPRSVGSGAQLGAIAPVRTSGPLHATGLGGGSSSSRLLAGAVLGGMDAGVGGRPKHLGHSLSVGARDGRTAGVGGDVITLPGGSRLGLSSSGLSASCAGVGSSASVGVGAAGGVGGLAQGGSAGSSLKSLHLQTHVAAGASLSRLSVVSGSGSAAADVFLSAAAGSPRGRRPAGA